MNTASPTTTSTPASLASAPDIAPRNRSVLRPATVGAAAATVVNVALWGVGRAAGASLVVDPALGDPNVEVGLVKVVVTTLLPFAFGVALLALAARRWPRWIGALAVAAGVFAVVSAAGPLEGGHDSATGVLLAAMHVTTGAAFVVAATSVKARGRRSMMQE